MTRQEKEQVIEELAGKLTENGNFYVTDASGLTVAQVNAFRRTCFDMGVEYRVYKNTLIKKALQRVDAGADHSAMDDVLKGFSGVIFSSEDNANVPAKAIKEYRKKNASEKPLLKAASIDSDLYIGENQLNMLSELKSKSELIGEIIGLLQSPAKNVVSALQSGKSTLAGLVQTLSEREN